MNWIEVLKSNQNSNLRLFCCHYAGGSASSFFPWTKYFSDNLEILGIQLPGHGSSCGKTPLDKMEIVIENLLQEFKSWLGKPFLLFGHSLGSLIIFELTKKLSNLSIFPEHLIVSGCRAPHLPLRRSPISKLPDDEFLSKLMSYNGTPKEFLNHQELLELFLPCLKADFKISETYQCPDRTPLSCNITAIVGGSDPDIHESDIKEWRQHTQLDFDYHVLPGDHFFINSARVELINIIKKIISNLTIKT